jgi:aryl-alcohol dehydrogenase-like predicted oxidoreductase
MMISGFATPTGTRRFAARFSGLASSHFRPLQDHLVSSIGLGTFAGEDDDSADASYVAAITAALKIGCNVIDTAVPYRHQRSERTVGATLSKLIADGMIQRDEVVISTKAGFIPYDSTYSGEVRQYFEQTYLRSGIFSAADVVANRHCLAPKFLLQQIETSRRNLKCQTIDIYYLHNPETQLESLDRKEFSSTIKKAFEELERAVTEGKIRTYGIATWDGFRVPPNSRMYLSLADLVRYAIEVAGADHHFRAIMLPMNISQPEGFTMPNQPSSSRDEWVPTLQATQDLGLTANISSSLNQGRLASLCPDILTATLEVGFGTNAQRALQFVRSTPGVTTALVGMSNPKHVSENLALASCELLPQSEVAQLFQLIGSRLAAESIRKGV